MGKKHFAEEQGAFALKQAESGTAVDEIIRKLGISKQTSSEEAVRRARHRRTASASNLGGGEQQAQANGCRPESRQEESAGRVLKNREVRGSACSGAGGASGVSGG